MLAALVLLPTSQASPPVTATTNAPADQQWDATIVEIHQQVLDDLASRRREFKAAKCKALDVYMASEHLQNIDLAMSTTKEQQVAAFARQAAFLRELEGEAATDKDKAFIQKWRERAEATLLHVKSLELSAADLEFDRQLYRSLVLQRARWAKEMQVQRIRRPRRNPPNGLIYPTLPPRPVGQSR